MNFIETKQFVLGANSTLQIPTGFVWATILNVGTSSLSIRSQSGEVFDVPPDGFFEFPYRNTPRVYKDITTFAGGACQIAYEL